MCNIKRTLDFNTSSVLTFWGKKQLGVRGLVLIAFCMSESRVRSSK